MSLRRVPRTLCIARRRKGFDAPQVATSTRYYASDAARPKENLMSSAHQMPSTTPPPAPKEVALTVKSHGPIKQNPNLSGQVCFLFLSRPPC